MADFERCFPSIVRHEGGYVNDKDDKGGETFIGITRKNHSNLTMWKIIDEYKAKYGTTYGIYKQMINNTEVMAQVKKIYKERYWDKLMLDKIRSQVVANQLMDDCINRGVSATVKMLSALYKCSTKVMTEQLITLINKKK